MSMDTAADLCNRLGRLKDFRKDSHRTILAQSDTLSIKAI
jgi:hypothetical protein